MRQACDVVADKLGAYRQPKQKYISAGSAFLGKHKRRAESPTSKCYGHPLGRQIPGSAAVV